MAKGIWPGDADRSKYRKAWYEPLTSEEDILSGLRFTLSHPIATAIPPGEAELFRIALALRDQIKPLKSEEAEAIKIKALHGNPLFRYPSEEPV
jgi:hypothetical protein